jgi:hypothetical protein
VENSICVPSKIVLAKVFERDIEFESQGHFFNPQLSGQILNSSIVPIVRLDHSGCDKRFIINRRAADSAAPSVSSRNSTHPRIHLTRQNGEKGPEVDNHVLGTIDLIGACHLL